MGVIIQIVGSLVLSVFFLFGVYTFVNKFLIKSEEK